MNLGLTTGVSIITLKINSVVRNFSSQIATALESGNDKPGSLRIDGMAAT